MEKCLCDICGRNPADTSYRVEQFKKVQDFSFGFFMGKKKWIKIDICKSCYTQLVNNSLKTEKVLDRY